MKVKGLFFRKSRGMGLIGALITTLLAAVAVIGVFYQAIFNSEEYRRFHQIARDVADNPSSHPNEEILNSGEALVKVMRGQLQSGTIGEPIGVGNGVALIDQAEDALRKVRLQQYVIKISCSPADPAPKQTVTVTIKVINSTTGTMVTYTLLGTDNYPQSGTLYTDANGQVSFTVPGALTAGVTDNIKVTVGSVTEPFSYTF